MVAAVALLAASCSDDFMLGSNMSGDEVTVAFTVAPQGSIGGTRADELTHISDGRKANMLIYAVYDEDYKLLPQYGKGVDEKLKTKFKEKGMDAPELGDGQTAIYVETYPIENSIFIRLVRGKTYKVAFWAQSLDCKSYNTKDLKKVEVIYGAEMDADGDIKTPNNDETRDVFCQVATVETSGDKDPEKTVTLYRPLAQINVGTSGYDFETATRGVNSKKYRYSKVQISSAARYFSVPENKVLTSTTDGTDGTGMTTEVLATLNYDFAPLPAYYNYNVSKSFESFDPSSVCENEEFLRVDLNNDKEISKYVSLEDYKENNEKINNVEDRKNANYTETFKYLSMCYILVPVQESDADNTCGPNNEKGETEGYTTTLDNVTVWLSEKEDPAEGEQLEIVRLTHVPVHRNWRTNIISQDLLTTGADLEINIEPMYSGDYNTDDLGATWSGPLAEGVYYDAVNDEILISSADGLKWLERMVNGKYCYWVYDMDGKPYQFKDEGIQDPTDPSSDQYPSDMSETDRKILKERIMRATHQDKNENADCVWPRNNNFHFMGGAKVDKAGSRLPHLVYPAKVRLMLDIDLSSYENKWIPIGFANNTAETYDVFFETNQDLRAFCGEFDGGNHTIYNLSNKRFGAAVYDGKEEDGYLQTSSNGPYDKAVQWFSVGLFGQIGQNGSVSNLRLKNVDLFGYCQVGGIAGTITGQDAFINNCFVDGGTITAAPMYRGDTHRTTPEEGNGRTFARGIYAGGIVGYVNIGRTTNTSDRAWGNYAGDNDDVKKAKQNDPNIDKYASIIGCDVRNITLRAYRQIGGIAGGLNNNDNMDMENNKVTGTSRRIRKFANNNVTNVTIIADKFQPYDIFFLEVEKNAFGWKGNQLAWSDIFLGGNPDNNKSTDFVLYDNTFTGNNSSNVIITEFATGVKDDDATTRAATIDQIPLNLMPMLSSFFTDNVTLQTNFTGKHSAYKYYTEHIFYSDSRSPESTAVTVPCELPYDLSIDWIKDSGKVGIYIESIKLTGNAKTGHTIVTVEDVMDEDDCVAYIGARNHSQIENKIFAKSDTHETIIKSMVFRGQPYAYTGICLAPNQSTKMIELTNVSVYDVYQTLVLDENNNKVDPSQTTLKVSDSNLRGYTNYGRGWKAVKFENTVFERGVYAVDGTQEKTQSCDVNTPTDFINCYFKAPYTINIAKDINVTMDGCRAATTTGRDMELDVSKISKEKGGSIIITSDYKGNPVIEYKENE